MFKFLIKLLAELGSNDYTVSKTKVSKETDFGNVELQVQDETGNWRTGHVTVNDYQMIASGMRQLAVQFPGWRVRAIKDGKIVDIF